MKGGSTGTLVFTTVVSRIYGPNGLAVEEERGTAFREAVQEGASSGVPKREEPPSDTVWETTKVCDEALLFRFSALTFNTHRIHYDTPWAKEVEGYPALVVHGPLLSTLLINFVRDMNPGKTIASYDGRSRVSGRRRLCVPRGAVPAHRRADDRALLPLPLVPAGNRQRFRRQCDG